jgi:uncharacterized lipoprotein YmbA
MKRRDTLAGLFLAPLVLAGCASDSVATRWYELRAEPPGPKPAPRPGDGAIWEVAGAVRLPGALDRDTLVVASGAATLIPLTGHRWAEPLRESIPSRLVADLAVLRGEGLVWRAPAPSGVVAGRRLRVEIVSLVADSTRRSLRLQARWWLSDERASPAPAPTLGHADFEVSLADSSVDALAAGHREAVWQLAQRIAS